MPRLRPSCVSPGASCSLPPTADHAMPIAKEPHSDFQRIVPRPNKAPDRKHKSHAILCWVAIANVLTMDPRALQGPQQSPRLAGLSIAGRMAHLSALSAANPHARGHGRDKQACNRGRTCGRLPGTTRRSSTDGWRGMLTR
eukprot:4066691-Pyramimonas_sp.AAC.1